MKLGGMALPTISRANTIFSGASSSGKRLHVAYHPPILPLPTCSFHGMRLSMNALSSVKFYSCMQIGIPIPSSR